MSNENQTEETNVKVENTDSDNGETTTEVNVEKSEKTEDSDDSEKSDEDDSEPKVNVNIDQTFNQSESKAAHDPHKNYEAAQPVIDGV